MKILFLLMLLASSSVFAHEDTLDVRFLGTQRTLTSPFSIPISVDLDGNIGFFGAGPDTELSFQPTVQLGISKTNITYSRPVILNRFNFYPVQKDLGLIEVKRKRVELGLGLASLIKSKTVVGIIPYKGSLQTLIHYKESEDEPSLDFGLPKELSEIAEWNVEDNGTYQTYGGLSAYAGFGVGVDLIRVSVGLQNQFIIDIKKISKEQVVLKISEEDLKRRDLTLGPFPVQVNAANFEGKKLSAEFTLNVNNPSHHDLFKEALNGNLKVLQDALSYEEQIVTWKGHDRSFYLGIPFLIGFEKSSGHYDLNEDGTETELDFKSKTNKGFFTHHRFYQDFVYQTDKSMVVIWSSEMNKADEKAFYKTFLSKGQIIGVRGFDRDVPDNTRFGSVVSQIGIQITKEEVNSLSGINMEEVETHLIERCLKFRLSCRHEKTSDRIMRKFQSYLKKPWGEMSGDLGLLLIKYPAIIYAVVKTLKVEKEIYFKFLSEKYQSLEGSSPVEI